MSEKVPRYVTSGAKLADLLGIHRNTIAAWMKEPGAPQHGPKGHPVKLWMEFASQIAKRTKMAAISPKSLLEMDKIAETVRGLKLKNDEDAGLLVRLDEVKGQINVLASELKGEIRSLGDKLPMALQGLGVAEQRAVILRMFNEMLDKVAKGEEAIA